MYQNPSSLIQEHFLLYYNGSFSCSVLEYQVVSIKETYNKEQKIQVSFVIMHIEPPLSGSDYSSSCWITNHCISVVLKKYLNILSAHTTFYYL